MDFFGNQSTLIALMILIAVMVFFLRYTQRASKASAERIKRMRKPPETMTLPAHNLDAPAHLAQAEVQMHDQARDLLGQLDTKIAIVQELVRTAEDRIVRLERLLGQAESQPSAVRPAPTTASPHAADAAPTTDTSQQRANLPAGANDQLHREIYELADAGHTSASIARQVCSPVGDVELILSLRGRK